MPEEKVAVVTGPTSGIGRWIAASLARAGMHAVLVARNPERAAATARWIVGQVPGAGTETVVAELSSVAETRAGAAAIAQAHPRIALLVNNAGVYSPRRMVTAEGNERTLAVNHLAPFVMRLGLLDTLRAAARPAW